MLYEKDIIIFKYVRFTNLKHKICGVTQMFIYRFSFIDDVLIVVQWSVLNLGDIGQMPGMA